MEFESNQNETLREKFINVLGPVIASRDEDNIATLLSSLSNICNPDAGLLVPSCENAIEEAKTSEFICWLISELLVIESSPKVLEASIAIQVNIFQLVGARNFKLFPNIIGDFIKIGQDGVDILFEGGQKLHHCFNSVIDREKASLKPKDIALRDNDSLDSLLSTVVKVLGNLGSYSMFYNSGVVLDTSWLLIGQCLEGGDLGLKKAALEAIARLIDVCCLPVTTQNQDYIIQLVGGCTVAIVRGDFKKSLANKSKEEEEAKDKVEEDVEENLSKVVQGLRRHLENICPSILRDIIAHLETFLQYTHRFMRLRDCLLRELLLLACDVVQIQSKSVPCFGSLSCLEDAVAQSLRSPQVIDICLKMLLFADFDKLIPDNEAAVTTGTKKRTYCQSENESLVIEGWAVSPWWNKVLDNVEALACELSDGSYEDSEVFDVNLTLLQIYLELSSDLLAHVSSKSTMCVDLFPQRIMQNLSQFFTSSLARAKSKEKILKLLSALKCLTFAVVASKAPANHKKNELLHTWVGLSSLPWLASEMNWHDLEPTNKNLLLSVSSETTWIGSKDIKASCIPVLALAPRTVASNWRSHVIKIIMSEAEVAVLASVAQWLPLALHQLPTSSSRFLLPESVGKLMNSEDQQILENLGKSLRWLLCSVSNQSEIRPKKGFPCSFTSLHCGLCQGASMSARDPKTQVDPALVQRLFPLVEHTKKEIVLAFLEGLPAVASHCTLRSGSFVPLMKLLLHKDQEIADIFAQKLTAFIKSSVKEEKKEKSPSKTENSGDIQEDNGIHGVILTFLEDLISTVDQNRFKNPRRILQVLSDFTRSEANHFEKEVFAQVAHLLASTDRETAAFSCLFLTDWSLRLNITPKHLYVRNRKLLAKVLAKVAREGEVVLVLSQLAEGFCWGRGREQKGGWISYGVAQLRYLLPPLILKSANEMQPSILQELATCLGLRLRDMLIDHFQHILAHLVFHCSEEEKAKVLAYISSTTNIQIESIRKCSVQNQVNELILGLHTHREAVLKEFLDLKDVENEKKTRLNSKKEKVDEMKLVGDFLAPRFLGILGFLDGKLVSSHILPREKECALLSMSELLVVMGKDHVSRVARKVLASLKTALKVKDGNILAISCRAWAAFLSRLDEGTLESVLEEVVILCLPLLRSDPESLSPVFKTILVDTPCVQPLLQYLPQLPQHQSLSAINEIIAKAQSHLQGVSKECVVGQLESLGRSLCHESQEVRLHSLKRLKTTLRKNQTVIHQLVLDSERAHRTVSDIFVALLGQCRENEELHLLVSECLGLFGAIDPSRLHTDASSHDKLSEIYTNHETEAFVTDLVMALSRAFLSATDASTQTCASYAMQEILRLYKISSAASRPAPASRSAQSLGSIVYGRLPTHIQEILKPLHSSKYTVTPASQQSPLTMPSPIYRTKYAKTFNHWVTSWTCSLIDLLVGETSKQIYSACKPLVRRDPSTALHLLPPLIVCVLTEAENNRVPVVTEILSIIEAENLAEGDIVPPSAELQQMAVQTTLSCLDYVRRWSHGRKQQETTYRKNTVIFSPSPQLQYVLDFLDQIPDYALASISFRAQAYSRALLHLESHLTKHPEQLKANLTFLQSIYVALDDPDGVAGVAAIRQEDPSLREQIIEYEATGRLHDALSCYERLCIAQESQESYEGMLKCYLNLGQPQSVLNITQGLNSRNNELGESLHDYRVEAAWRLGQWEQLEMLLNAYPNKSPQSLSWGVGVGRALLAAREGSSNSYWRAMHRLRVQQITPLSAASMEKGAYQRAYPYILRLQILNEMDEVLSGLLKIPAIQSTESLSESQTPADATPSLSLKELTERWCQRLSLVQTSHRFLEPLLNFRRTVLRFGIEWVQDSDPELSQNLLSELERTWLRSAKVARKAGHFQQGELAFYGAGQGRDVFMERAKWHWAKGEQPQAVAVLKRGVQKFFPSPEIIKQSAVDDSISDRQCLSQAKLLLAQYSEESATLDVVTIKQYYRDVCEIHRSWEDGHFNLAMYYDRILNSLEVKDKPADWLLHIVQSFGKSLHYGCRHLYQSMPRLLSIWLDHGAKVAEMQTQKNQSANHSVLVVFSEKLKTMNSFLMQILERLPGYMFFIALPQLISRICHSHIDVFDVLCKIIASMLAKFPRQSMWHMIAVSKSSYEMRRERCQKIFEMAKRYQKDLNKFIFDSTKLGDLFIELSDMHAPKGTMTVSLRNSMRSLPRLLSESNFSNIILPLQHQMNVTLPTSYGSDSPTSLGALFNHNPFPRKEIYICGIEDEVEVMASLVRPKKVTLKCSDGLKYIMMCKPKDDMRKDCRLMEFNSFVNLLLMKDPESRKRSLKIRTYMVVPLNEECGLVEWIPNLCSLRTILHKLYREKGTYISGQDLKNLICRLEDSLIQKRDTFLTKLLPKHPPIFTEWFLLTFVDPQAWLRARWAYCRTMAVMSMVGYIVGLGDRHGENILMDSQSGDTVHVDFNCLFNKGETFEWPERVPFRLTHNMVTAMGPTGYEGIFRKSCEVTMRVMRKQRDELMSVLKPFVYDPLVEWEKADKKGAASGIVGKTIKDQRRAIGEICNAKAQVLVKDIEERLNGQIRSKARGAHLPLSVEGQVNVLIEDATSLDNLCQMYAGWTPFM